MTPAEIHSRLQAVFGDAILEFQETLFDPVIVVAPARLHEVCRHLRDDASLQMNYLRIVTGVDRPPETIEVVYHLVSLAHHHGIVLRVRLPRTAPRIDSLADLWPTANWHEREQLDLFGIEFVNHPDPRRLFMPLDWVGHPLRKDYERPLEYHGIPGNRELASTRIVSAPTQPVHTQKDEELDGFMRINMGPHHPATHGVHQLPARDRRRDHPPRAPRGRLPAPRASRRSAELTPYAGTMPYTDRIDYLGAMFTNHGWALAVEKLAGIERAAPRRVLPRDRERAQPHRQPPHRDRIDRDGHRRVHALHPLAPRARDDQRHPGAHLRRAAHLQLHALRRRRPRHRRGDDRQDPALARSLRADDRRVQSPDHRQRDLRAPAGEGGDDQRGRGDRLRAGRAEPARDGRRRGTSAGTSRTRSIPSSTSTSSSARAGAARSATPTTASTAACSRCASASRSCARPARRSRRARSVPRACRARSSRRPTRSTRASRARAARRASTSSPTAATSPIARATAPGRSPRCSIIDHLSPGLMLADLVVLIGSLDVIAPEVDR